MYPHIAVIYVVYSCMSWSGCNCWLQTNGHINFSSCYSALCGKGVKRCATLHLPAQSVAITHSLSANAAFTRQLMCPAFNLIWCLLTCLMRGMNSKLIELMQHSVNIAIMVPHSVQAALDWDWYFYDCSSLSLLLFLYAIITFNWPTEYRK